ncbi:unnamed protein product [Linum tenue]|uniref:Fe2OG dioxygenase domain-containing protein n=1 Tax=Linum tenue TaxID=586396 RepID=A0AAV0LBG9_9ROSI|nr:unnamed protein product [Linum tenue]
MAASSVDSLYFDNAADSEEAARLFDETKGGVKGLVDSGITTVPKLFRLSPQTASQYGTTRTVPVIDMKDLESRRAVVVEEIRRAAAELGMFQLVNHGVEVSVMEDMMAEARQFHEQPTELKQGYYSRDVTQKARFISGYGALRRSSFNWVDTLLMTPAPSDAQDHLPIICRDSATIFIGRIRELGETLSQLLSLALGLTPSTNEFISTNLTTANLNYYPPCPEPEVAIAANPHFDTSTFTILLQDQVGGLQVFHEGAADWVDVPSLHGALVVNIGNMLQLLSNNKMKSAEHKVFANAIVPRQSVACFFMPPIDFSTMSTKMYGPIKELVSEKYPAVYREASLAALWGSLYPDLEGSLRNPVLARLRIAYDKEVV